MCQPVTSWVGDHQRIPAADCFCPSLIPFVLPSWGEVDTWFGTLWEFLDSFPSPAEWDISKDWPGYVFPAYSAAGEGNLDGSQLAGNMLLDCKSLVTGFKRCSAPFLQGGSPLSIQLIYLAAWHVART